MKCRVPAEGLEILVVGAGTMGAQIAAEYAVGGHHVTTLTRRPRAAAARVETALASLVQLGLRSAGEIAKARSRITSGDFASRFDGFDLIVESLPEDFGVKCEVIAPLARANREATIASNTSSLSIVAIGQAIGCSERTLGTHYLNPALLMPPVELIAGEASSARVNEQERQLLALGKRPLHVADVSGFLWNRLQAALLRESLAIVRSGIADAEAVDAVVREGLGRRWSTLGPFETAAAGGPQTFERMAANVFPALSNDAAAPGLRAVLDERSESAADRLQSRDAVLARALRP